MRDREGDWNAPLRQDGDNSRDNMVQDERRIGEAANNSNNNTDIKKNSRKRLLLKMSRASEKVVAGNSVIETKLYKPAPTAPE